MQINESQEISLDGKFSARLNPTQQIGLKDGQLDRWINNLIDSQIDVDTQLDGLQNKWMDV